MAVLALLYACFDILIAVSILSLPSILPISGLFVAVSFATGLVGLEVLGFEGLDGLGLGAGTVAGVDFGSLGSEPFASSSASVNPSPSSSVSVVSGIPSLSVSLKTVNLNLFSPLTPAVMCYNICYTIE